MINKTKYIQIAVLITMMITGIGMIGCQNGSEIGEGIPDNKPVMTLADVLETPENYHEKTFVLNGTVSSQCSALCDFVLTDGGKSATIYSQDFKFPKLALGKPVTVYVQATSGERLILSALGMRI